jgi:hypothetical protein
VVIFCETLFLESVWRHFLHTHCIFWAHQAPRRKEYLNEDFINIQTNKGNARRIESHFDFLKKSLNSIEMFKMLKTYRVIDLFSPSHIDLFCTSGAAEIHIYFLPMLNFDPIFEFSLKEAHRHITIRLIRLQYVLCQFNI